MNSISGVARRTQAALAHLGRQESVGWDDRDGGGADGGAMVVGMERMAGAGSSPREAQLGPRMAVDGRGRTRGRDPAAGKPVASGVRPERKR
jgi:hypothetical protein